MKISQVFHAQKEYVQSVKINRMKTFSIGDQVEHILFGRGKILNIESSIDNTKLTIEFSGNVRKKIISKYVKLVKE